MGLVYMARWSLVTLSTFWSLVTLRYYIYLYMYVGKYAIPIIWLWGGGETTPGRAVPGPNHSDPPGDLASGRRGEGAPGGCRTGGAQSRSVSRWSLEDGDPIASMVYLVYFPYMNSWFFMGKCRWIHHTWMRWAIYVFPIPRHPVIPPEVRCFRYVFGVQIPSQEVFGCLGYWSGSFFLKGHVNFQGGCLVIALWIYGRNPAKLIEIPWFTRFFTSTRWLFVWDFWIINRMEFRGKFGRRPLEERGFHHGGDQHFLFLLAAGSISKGPSIQINDICFLVRNILSEVEPNLLQ